LPLNVALHGLEKAAGVRCVTTDSEAGNAKRGSPSVTRYADDLVACCFSQEQAQRVKAELAVWLAGRGLAFNEAKTRIVEVREGFDFLGFSIRRYRNGKLLIKPSDAAIKRIRQRLRAEFRRLRGCNVAVAPATIVPIVRGSPGVHRLSHVGKSELPGRILEGDGGYVADQELLVSTGRSQDLYASVIEAITHFLVQPLHAEPEEPALLVQLDQTLLRCCGPRRIASGPAGSRP
jgi:hypothetical protein